MKILEARFYPETRSHAQASVVVAHIYCSDAWVEVEPVPLAGHLASPSDVDAPFAKLRYLVERVRHDPYNELRALRSEYWSFEVAQAGS